MTKLLILFFTCITPFGIAQISPLTWEYAAPYQGGKRDDGSGFNLNAKGYYGCGIDEYYQLKKDWWQYDAIQDRWIALDTLPSTARQYCAVLEINGQVFLVGGSTPNGVSNEVFQFDDNLLNWIKRKNAPFYGLAAAASLSYNNVGFIIGGRNDSVKLNSFWKYLPEVDEWHQLPNPPFDPRDEMSAFSLGTDGYVLLGRNDSNETYSEVYNYDFVTELWTRIADYAGDATTYVECKSLSAEYAICAGGQSKEGELLNEAFLFSKSNQVFSPLPDLIEPEIRGMQSFVIDASIYFIAGLTPRFTRTQAVQKLRFEKSDVSESITVLNIYPNPSNDFLRIELRSTPIDQIEKVELMSSFATITPVSFQKANGYVLVDTRELVNGLYIIKISLSNEEVIGSKVLVIH